MSIHIKKSKRGTLHDAVGVPRGEKIPASKLEIHKGDSSALKKKKQFAINAKSWNHGQNGISVPSNYQEADEEIFRNFQQDQNVSVEPFQGQYSDGLQPLGDVQGLPQDFQSQQQDSIYKYKQPYRGEYGQAALAGLLAVDALIPNRKQPSQVVRPMADYNPNPYGNNSRSIAQNGTAMTPKFKPTYSQLQSNFQELQGDVKRARNTGVSQDATLVADNSNKYLNNSQQFFYNALTNPSQDLTDVYRGFNDTIQGREFASTNALVGQNNPNAGLTTLEDGDKRLLQDEYFNYSKKFKGNKEAYFKDLKQRGVNDPRVSNLLPAASFALNQQYEYGGKVSNMGYKANSPDRHYPKLTIPSNEITMKGVNHPVYGIDDTGYQQLMQPGQDYKFPGNHVTEYPMKKMGGKVKCANGSKLKDIYEEGGTYEMDENTIKHLISQGYEINIH